MKAYTPPSFIIAKAQISIHALKPGGGSSGVVACPELEVLFIKCKETLDVERVVGMAAARESRGAKLKSPRIISRWGTCA